MPVVNCIALRGSFIRLARCPRVSSRRELDMRPARLEAAKIDGDCLDDIFKPYWARTLGRSTSGDKNAGE